MRIRFALYALALMACSSPQTTDDGGVDAAGDTTQPAPDAGKDVTVTDASGDATVDATTKDAASDVVVEASKDATPDAANDASADAGMDASAECISYCSCMTSYCAGYLDASCLDICADLGSTALSCRSTHCGYAMTDPGTHCPHAAGYNTCP